MNRRAGAPETAMEDRTMKLERTETGFQIDAAALGPLLGVPVPEVQHLMRAGQITSICEEGRDEHAGRHRITFLHGETRLRLIVNGAGEVLLQMRTPAVLPTKPDCHG
jgi:hypothetical protein